MLSKFLQPTYSQTGCLPLHDESDVVTCRRVVRHVAAECAFSITGQTMLVTAASELARNALVHGGGGTFSWELLRRGVQLGIRLTFEDEGPGIADIESAMANGWTTGRGLGLGLPGARRLVHEFEIWSTPNRGTRIVITRFR